MKAVWLEDRALSLREVPTPEAAGEALVRVRLAGVCGTDLELVRGYYPFAGIPGHEFVGEVVEAPEPGWVGRRVVGEINVPCGACAMCERGLPTHCERRTVLGITDRNGVHAEYTTLPLANLHAVPDAVPDEIAVFTEPLAAACEILEQVRIGSGDRVLVIGAGRLGQLIAQVIAQTDAGLAVVARHPRQMELLEARDITVLAEDDVASGAYDIVIEATGSPSGLDLARRALRARGTLVLKSTYHGSVTLDLSPFVVDEITIVGSRCGPFEPALRMLADGVVDPSGLIEARFSLDDALEAYEAAAVRGAMKVLIEP